MIPTNDHPDKTNEGCKQRPGQHGDHGGLLHTQGHQGRGGIPQGCQDNIKRTPKLLQLFKSNLQALGMARTAEVKRDARIGEKNLSEQEVVFLRSQSQSKVRRRLGAMPRSRKRSRRRRGWRQGGSATSTGSMLSDVESLYHQAAQRH